MTKTQTVTKTKKVEVEEVECSSCGQSIEKDAAYKFSIGERNPTSGWACEYCAEDPVGFPVVYREWVHDVSAEDIILLIFLTLILIAIPFVI